jgi:NADPH-dependent glutamate synthase beta subunit-like oxidoreductase
MRRGESTVKIAIVGSGPAGCHLAHLLTDAVHEILLQLALMAEVQGIDR